MMGEITMPIDLAAAMSVLAGGGDIAVTGNDGTGFGEILGQLMGTAVPSAETVTPEADADAADAEAILPERAAEPADAVAAFLAGDETAELPEVFDTKGAEAFLKTLDKFLDGKLNVSDIKKFWQYVPEDEKAAYARLLETVFAGGNFTVSDADGNDDTFLADDSLKAVLAMVAKTAKKKPETDAKSDDVLAAYFMQGVNFLNIRSAAPVTEEAAAAESGDAQLEMLTETVPPTSESEVVLEYAVSDMMIVQSDVPAAKTDDKDSETPDAEGITVDREDNFLETIQNVYDKISEKSPDDIVSFCKALSEELKAELSESYELPEAVVQEPEEITDGYMFEDGRQAFMARVGRPAEIQAGGQAEETAEVTETAASKTDDAESTERDISALAQAEQDVQIRFVPENTVSETEHILPEESDISSQIIEKIELYRDIFSEDFSEKEITMQLRPEELGGLEIKIRKSGDGIEIRFRAERPEAAELIGDRASQLAEAVASRGIKLKEMYVSEKIVTEEASSRFSDGSENSHRNDYYGGAADSDPSGRKFTFSGSFEAAEVSEETEEEDSVIYNREAKLWVSA